MVVVVVVFDAAYTAGVAAEVVGKSNVGVLVLVAAAVAAAAGDIGDRHEPLRAWDPRPHSGQGHSRMEFPVCVQMHTPCPWRSIRTPKRRTCRKGVDENGEEMEGMRAREGEGQYEEGQICVKMEVYRGYYG